MLDSWSVYLTFTEWCHVGLVICVSDIYRMMPCWTRDLCIWHLQNDAMLDSWSVYLTLYRMASCWTRDLYLTLYMMTQCWTRDLCIWHYTEWCWTRDLCIWHYTWWRNVGLVICVSDIIHDDAMLDSWSVYLTLYMMTQCWTRDLCIWHDTEWRNVGLVICVSGIIQNDVGLVICAPDIIQNDVGLVICVSDIIQDENMSDSWSVYLTLYRMASCWTRDLHLTLYRMMMDLWSVYLTFTEWHRVGLVICVSDIIQNGFMLD